ncbi:MAG: sugar porter family MFS transporter [Rhodothermales bacterium]|nr:sugar porter family MFS transporter [Rhodothermales bacterium]MBO6779427.1 sugar porter family MFS transporter [Rhodothermales bacterium]
MTKYRYVMRVALTVAMGGFLMGFDASVISGVVGFIETEFSLSKIELGWAVSSLTLTATLAMMTAGPLSDRFGRRKVLFWAAILFAVSAIASAFAPNFWTLVVARMIGGFGVGASLIIAPMYIAEIAPPAVRGQMVSFNQLNIVVGISAAFFSNYLILQLGQSDAGWVQSLAFEANNWRWMLGVETLPALLYFVGLFFVPESPRWLMLKGRELEARGVLEDAVGKEEAHREVADIQASLAKDADKEKASVRELFAPAMRLVITIGVVIGVIQQITGINSVFFYAPMIFEQSGIGTDASFAQAILVGLINLVFTVIAIMYIDKLGRKALLVAGLSGITVSMFVLTFGFGSATYTLTADSIATLPTELNVAAVAPMQDVTYDNDVAFKQALQDALGEAEATQNESAFIKAAISMNPWLVLIGVLGFVASFAVSLGPVMWVLFSELFPNRIRGIAISFVGLINSAVSFGVQLVFPWELATLGSATTFFIYGLFAVVGLVFVVAKLPETKGRSLEELEAILVKA